MKETTRQVALRSRTRVGVVAATTLASKGMKALYRAQRSLDILHSLVVT